MKTIYIVILQSIGGCLWFGSLLALVYLAAGLGGVK